MEFDPIVLFAEWAESLMLGWGFSEALSTVILKFIGAAVVAGLVMVIFILQTWIERKMAGRLQDRIGPNRVGPFGLFQPIADAIKMIIKEDTTPGGADKFFYNAAPVVGLFSVLAMWAVIPFTETWFGTDLNVGLLYLAAVGSFGVLGILMAGWSSNNKYSLLGAFRGVAQLISYEVPLFLAMLIPVLLARSMSLNDIVKAQDNFNWFIWSAPLAALIYFVSNMAEIGRAPFDLLEADSEIVAGYHIEYSGMKFGLFQATEFTHSFTAGALISILFFGGWRGPFVDAYPLLGLVYFFIKAFFFYWVIMWVRLTVPRIRIDHMMALNWKFMVPTVLVLLMTTPILDYYVQDMGAIRIVAHLALNLMVFAGAWTLGRNVLDPERPGRVRFPERPVARPPKEEEAAA